MNFLILSFLLNLSAPAFSSEPLPSYNIDSSKISISGISSGAFMAVQMGVAYSKTFSGVGSIAGGIYGCALGQPLVASQTCMKNPDALNVSFFVEHTKNLETYNYIDSTEHLKRQKIYIFSSTGDDVVNMEAGQKLKEYYQAFVPQNNIYMTSTPHTAHGFPTIASGGPCQDSALPWILNCQFDAAYEILHQIYGNLKSRTTAKAANLFKFNQNDFGGLFSSLESDGYLYVPESCKGSNKCKLHVALHGCQMNSEFIQDQFAKTAGYNEWAENNQMIVLYPQSSKNVLNNPNGCWDWFGYTGLNYTTKFGTQMSALMKMIQRIQRY